MLYPVVCPFCGQISPKGICDECSGRIIYITEPRCMKCGKSLQSDAEEFCPDCRERRSHNTKGKGLWIHREPVAGALYRFKYRNKRQSGRILARELAMHYTEQIRKWEIEEIIPIPLHFSRRRSRGFNQAEVIAGELAAASGIPVRTNVLFRIKKTSPQKSLGKNERQGNLQGALPFPEAGKCGKTCFLLMIYIRLVRLWKKPRKCSKRPGLKMFTF